MHPLAVIYPFLVDGFIVVASLAAVAMRGQPKPSKRHPWILLVLFFAFSVLGNALHADARQGIPQLPPIAAAAVSAVPPIALGLAIHLLLQMISTPRPTPLPIDTVQPQEPEGGLREVARRLLEEAAEQGRHMNGAQLARKLGVSDRHGRRLLADCADDSRIELSN